MQNLNGLLEIDSDSFAENKTINLPNKRGGIIVKIGVSEVRIIKRPSYGLNRGKEVSMEIYRRRQQCDNKVYLEFESSGELTRNNENYEVYNALLSDLENPQVKD